MAMCRACGDCPGDADRLKENLQKYSDIYFNLTSIRLTSDEDPDRQKICDDCRSKLLEYNRFRTVCLQVHYRLTEIKTEIDYDHSEHMTVECQPLLVKVECFDPPEDDVDAEDLKDGIANDDEEEDDDDDDEDYEEDENIKLKDKGSDQELLRSKTDQASDEDVKEPKNPKKKKKKKEKGDGPKEVLLPCNQCERKFRTDERLQGHLRTHQGLKPALCNLCGKDFHKFHSLKRHMKRKHLDVKNEFICDFPECGLSYSSKQSLCNHRKRHDPNFVQPESKRVVCDQCGKTFSNAGGLKKHSYIHTGDMPFQCQVCNKKLPTAHKLKEHTMRHEGVKNHVCPYCGLKKTTRHELKVHMNYHTKEKQFTCQFCAHVYSNVSSMTRHIKVVHCGVRAFSCTYCDLSFGKAETLKNHVMTHTGEKPHECTVCGKRFIQAVALRTHMKTHRKYEQPQQPDRSPPIGGYVDNSKHSYTHSGDMPFQCQVCNKKLPTAHKLKEHTMRHEGIKNHVCPHCGMKKTTRNELKIHMNYHTKEKQYPCQVCDQVFSASGNLSRHIKIVHCGIKAFNCTYCDLSFGKAETLKHHVMTHTGEKPHECTVCGKRFIQSVALQTHMKTHRKYGQPQPADRSPPIGGYVDNSI